MAQFSGTQQQPQPKLQNLFCDICKVDCVGAQVFHNVIHIFTDLFSCYTVLWASMQEMVVCYQFAWDITISDVFITDRVILFLACQL